MSVGGSRGHGLKSPTVRFGHRKSTSGSSFGSEWASDRQGEKHTKHSAPELCPPSDTELKGKRGEKRSETSSPAHSVLAAPVPAQLLYRRSVLALRL